MLPISVSDFPGRERGVFSIAIVDIILRSTLVGFRLLHASYYYISKGLVCVNPTPRVPRTRSRCNHRI